MYVVLGASLAWAILSILLFFSDYRRLNSKGYFPGPHGWKPPHERPGAGPAEIDRLESWATFAFVNHVLKLPPEYLKEALAIPGSAYPNQTIAEAASVKGISAAVLLAQLKDVLRERVTPPPASAISSPPTQ